MEYLAKDGSLKMYVKRGEKYRGSAEVEQIFRLFGRIFIHRDGFRSDARSDTEREREREKQLE